VKPLNQFRLRLKALFKRSAGANDAEDPNKGEKQEQIARDLSPAQDAIGGVSKGGLEAKPDQDRPREIDFMDGPR